MAGDIATAYVALVPSMKGFGAAAARQIGPQARVVGATAGAQAGAAFSTAAGKQSSGWLADTAKGALKNVALYGSMYAVITNVQRGISAALDSMVGFNAEIEQATIGFETLTGSAAAAQDQMQWIQDFAKETPFQYEDLVGYSQQLLALGFNATEARDVLQATGDAAAALGRGSESIQRINLALGQMWTKGKVQSQEMLQLTEAGIGAWDILADAYGTSVADVQDAVTAGLIKATDAVPALIAGMNSRFGGLMEKQSQTFTGIVSNIQDTLQQELAGAGEPLFAQLKTQAEAFLETLDDPEVIEMMDDLGQILADGVKVLAESGKLAWQFRDGILAVGIAIAASKLLAGVPTGSMLSASTWFSATTAQAAYNAGLTRTTALQAGLTAKGASVLLGVGKIAGITAVVDGYRRVSEAGDDAAQSAWGVAEGFGGGALAGAAFGSVIPGVGTAVGAASGAVIGLTASVIAYSSAIAAADNDTTAIQQSFQDLGVDANLVALALDGITNKEIEAAGGADALIKAMQSGTFSEYVAGLKTQSDALKEQAGALDDQATALLDSGDMTEAVASQYSALIAEAEGLSGAAHTLDTGFKALSDSGAYLYETQDQITAAAYQSAYAMDLQTGSLGDMTEAAWQAVLAEGGLGAEAVSAALRMEGLAGVAGYVTQMIAGIPAGTAINFSTNASDIALQITQLQAAAQAGFSSLGMTPDAYERKLKSLQSQYANALSGTSVKLSYGGSGGSGGSSGAAAAASSAASDAAQKLKDDRTAQLRFGEAFGSLMESALSGDFDQYRDRLAAEIKSLTEDGYKKAASTLNSLSTALTTASKDYAVLTSKLKAASDTFDDLTASMQDQYTASRDLITGLGQVTDAQSFDQLAYLLGETTSAATQYQSILSQLKDQGLSEDLWNQLAQAGPESMTLAQSILAQGQGGIDQLNSLSGGLLSAAESMGDLVANSMYGQGVDAMQAYIEGLKSQSTALENQLETIANNVLTKTAGAITPGNAGYSAISAAPQETVNEFNLSISADSLGDLQSVQDFIAMLESASTTQLVNQAGTVTS